MQSRSHLATFTQADLTFVLVPLLFTSRYFFSNLFTLSQLCRCCSTNPPRPTLHWRAMSEQCSTSKDWVRINSCLLNLLMGFWKILRENIRVDWLWMLDITDLQWFACLRLITWERFKKFYYFYYFLCVAMKLYIYIPFKKSIQNSFT